MAAWRSPVWLVILACVLGGWWMAETTPVHGDMLNFEMFYREVVVLHHTLATFQFSQATFAFPDFVAMAAIRLVVPSGLWALLIYEVLYLGALAALLWRIYGIVWGEAASHETFALGFALMTLALCSTPDFRSLVLVPGIHGTIQLLFLLWVWQLTALAQTGGGQVGRWAVLGFLTAAGFAASDLLVLPSVIVPGFVALLWLASRRRLAVGAACGIIAANATGVVVGIGATQALVHAGILQMRPLRVLGLSWSARSWVLQRVMGTMADRIIDEWFAAVLVLAIAASVLLLRRRSPGKVEARPEVHAWVKEFWAFGLLVLAVKIGAIVFTARWKDLYSMRYLQEVEYLPLVWLVIWGVPALGLRCREARRAGQALIAAAVVVLALMPHRFPHLVPQAFVQCMDAHAGELPSPWGFADFWLSREVTFYSRRSLVVNPVTDKGTPYVWEDSPAAFSEDVWGRRIERTSYVIVPDDHGRVRVEALWGTATRSFVCPLPPDSVQILVYPDGITARAADTG